MLKVRRLLEMDLGMEKFALDEHKRFIKQHVCELLGVTNDGVDSDLKTEIGGNDVSPMEVGAADSGNRDELKSDKEAPDLVKDISTDDSPTLGLVSGNQKTEQGIKKALGDDTDENIHESVVKAALLKRANYFRANLDNITMAGVRRLLEDDLKLESCCLDPFKKFISRELDELLKRPPVSKSQLDKKKSSKNIVYQKACKTISNKRRGDSSDSKTQESSEEKDASSRKHIASKGRHGKKQLLQGPKKRKLTANETQGSRKKRKSLENDHRDAEVDRNSSENDVSPSSAVKNKASTHVYGNRVEQLKSIIKSCGIRIPPVIYKRAKQAPENKQEAALTKELVEILSKEGLPANPIEKEIKDVRRRKERERELEGIDMSNIVSSSRRRSTTSFVAPVKPKLPVENDDSQSDSEDDDGEDSDSGDNDDPKDEIDENDEAKSDSQSEEHKEGKDEDSD
ncbi:hypothetical protein QQ045_032107 [Rhodiola kirilowii]